MKSIKFIQWLTMTISAVCWTVTDVRAGEIVPTLDDKTALANYTAARAGVVNDTIDLTSGKLTLAARFNPDPSQRTGGPIIVIEIGGTTNGTGLYLGDGNLIFAAKSTNQLGLPTSMNDTDFSDNALAITLGPVKFGVENEVYVSFDAGTGKLLSSINHITRLYTITGSNASKNLDGTRSVSFLGSGAIIPGQMGGLVETGADQFPLLFWNNAMNMVQTPGYNNQRGQVFENVVVLELLPHNPNPANGAVNVDPAVVTQLQFNTAKDPGNLANQNPNVTGHYVTLFQIQNGEPNLVLPPVFEAFAPAGTDPISVNYTFDLDDVVYWQVEEQISGCHKGDPNNIDGLVWYFKALPSSPVVTVSPGNVAVFLTEQASFTCQFTSKAVPTAVEWYKTGSANPLDAADPDITITTIQSDGLYTSTLTIDNVEAADEGTYYCCVENEVGQDISDSATLGVKRKVAHWTLDNNINGYNNGQYVDSSGEGHHAAPDGGPVFSSNTPGILGGQSLNMTSTGNDRAAADSGNWATSLYTGETTVSAWVNWAGPDGGWQGLVSNRRQVGMGYANYYIEIRQDNGNLQIGGIVGMGDLQVSPLPIGEWVHVAITAKAGEVVIYLNGEAANRSTAGQAVPQNIVPLYIGALNRDTDSGALLSTFNGYLDDVQIFNYALTKTEVIDLYYAVMETPVCANLNNLDLRFDVAGGGDLGDQPDCQVNLADFAAFASSWFNCGLYPAEECSQ